MSVQVSLTPMSNLRLVIVVSATLAFFALPPMSLTIGNVAGMILRDSGRDAWQAGQHTKGLRILKVASYLAPMNAQVWATRCGAYDGQKYPNEIPAEISTCKRAATLDPESWALHDLGFAYVDAAQYAEAAAAFAPVANKNDEYSSVPYINVPYVASLLLAKDYQRAIPAAQRIVQIEKSRSAEASLIDQILLGMAYEGSGNAEMAKLAYGTYKTCRIDHFARGNIATSCWAR